MPGCPVLILIQYAPRPLLSVTFFSKETSKKANGIKRLELRKNICTEWGLNPRSRRLPDLKSGPLDHSGIRAKNHLWLGGDESRVAVIKFGRGRCSSLKYRRCRVCDNLYTQKGKYLNRWAYGIYKYSIAKELPEFQNTWFTSCRDGNGQC